MTITSGKVKVLKFRRLCLDITEILLIGLLSYKSSATILRSKYECLNIKGYFGEFSGY